MKLNLRTGAARIARTRSIAARAAPLARGKFEVRTAYEVDERTACNVVSGGSSLVWAEIQIGAVSSAVRRRHTPSRSSLVRFGFDVLAPRGPRGSRIRAARRGARATPRALRTRYHAGPRSTAHTAPCGPVSLVAGLSHPNSRVSRSSLGSRISVFGSRLASPRRLAASQCTLVGPVVRNVLPNSGS